MSPPAAPLPALSAENAGHDAAADGQTAFAHREAEVLVQSHRLLKRDLHRGGVPGHEHFDALGELERSRHARRPEVEIRLVALEDGRTPTSFLLAEQIEVRLER